MLVFFSLANSVFLVSPSLLHESKYHIEMRKLRCVWWSRWGSRHGVCEWGKVVLQLRFSSSLVKIKRRPQLLATDIVFINTRIALWSSYAFFYPSGQKRLKHVRSNQGRSKQKISLVSRTFEILIYCCGGFSNTNCQFDFFTKSFFRTDENQKISKINHFFCVFVGSKKIDTRETRQTQLLR